MLRNKLYGVKEPQQEEETDLLDLSLQNCPTDDISRYFPNFHHESPPDFTDQLLQLTRNFNTCLNQVSFKSPVQYIYNPTEYAQVPYDLYFKKYCQATKKLLFVGMNPGPFGMCQTGIPFGDTTWVKNWLHIEGFVGKPVVECPDRPVLGFSCTRKEQSGDRFWKFWSELCGTAENFFRNAFVYNYCPLAFMDATGRNVTPPDMKDCKQLEAICDKFYLDIVNIIQPQIIITIGRYIEKCTLNLFKSANVNIPVICMPHPSPRSVNNHNWPEKARLFLETNNLMQYFQ